MNIKFHINPGHLVGIFFGLIVQIELIKYALTTNIVTNEILAN
mgnify:CR=1 FL=1